MGLGLGGMNALQEALQFREELSWKNRGGPISNACDPVTGKC